MKNWRNSDDIEKEMKILIAVDREDMDRAALGNDSCCIKHSTAYWFLMILAASSPELSV